MPRDYSPTPSPSPSPSAGTPPKAPIVTTPTKKTPATGSTGTTKFNIDTSDPSTTSPYANNMLPNGNYDVYNIGTLYDKTLFTGYIANYDDVARGQGGYRNHPAVSVSSSSVEDYLRKFSSVWLQSPKTFMQLQAQLMAAGVYGSSGPDSWGIYTTSDRDAMLKVINGYLGSVNPNNPHPLTISEYIDELTKSGIANGKGIGGGSGGGGASRAPLQLTSSATLQQVANQQGQQNLGRTLNSDEQKAFVDKFHGEEQSAYNGGPENPGDPNAEAQALIQKNNNAEYQTHLQAGYADQILKMLGVSG